MKTASKEITTNGIYEQEIKNVQANKFLSESEKENKISQLKLLITMPKKKISPDILAFAEKNNNAGSAKTKPATKLPDNLSPALKQFINKNNSLNK